MSTSCQDLATRYAKETTKTIPDSSASVDTKSQWLLTQTWGCVVKGQVYTTAAECKSYNNLKPPQRPASTVNTRPPMFNYLIEDGFLHWVNQRGLQCINRITGKFFGLDPNTGVAKIPSATVTPPQPQCVGACRSVTSDRSACFECINQLIAQSTPATNPCPEVDPTNPENTNLLRDAVNCHECIANQSVGVPVTPIDASINSCWSCVTGVIQPPISIQVIIISAILGAMVLTVGIVLIVFYKVIKPRIEKKNQENQRLVQTGYNPDDL